MSQKTISIVTHAYNEEDNIEAIYLRIREIMSGYPQYAYEHLFIDNHSTDSTVPILKRLAAADPHVKAHRQRAQLRPHPLAHPRALPGARRRDVIGIASDFQEARPRPDSPDDRVHGSRGFLMVLCVKRSSGENGLMYWLRRKYYQTVERLSSIETIQNYTGFGLYDRKVVDLVRSFNDPYPYFRGMIAEIGLPNKRIYFDQPARKRGITKNNFYILYDIAMLGIISTSKVPLRMATFAGFLGAALCFLVALIYFLLKLFLWNTFSVGIAPMIIGVFFTQSIMLVFFGILGEYIGAIYTKVQQRPYAVELERINFEYPPAPPAAPASEPVLAASSGTP